MTEDRPLAIVAGAGPGLGHALLRRFEQGGFRSVGFVRTKPANGEGVEIAQVDLTDPDEVNHAVGALVTENGPPGIVVHNTAHLVIRPFADTTLAEFEESWRAMVLSAAVLAQSVVPSMVGGSGGTFIVSGATASLRGGANFAAFASAKFALRGLTQSLARAYQSDGIHVVHTILDGIIDTEKSRNLHTLDPDRMMKPGDIAEAYWQLAHQPHSTWSHEIDLRPRSESF
ncbi:MAG: SDR family NAD(P)-dependent oxidoreductase [Pseudomonadota bacterium]